MSNEKAFLCPAINREVDSTECLVICDVTDHMLKSSVLDRFETEIKWSEEIAEKCLACEWHWK